MKYQAVLFDLDGVLVHSKEVWFHLLNAAARDFGEAAIDRERMEGAWGQGAAADQQDFFPRRSLADVEAYYNAHFMDHIAHIQVDPDAARVFAALKSAGRPHAVVTNTPTEVAQEILSQVGLSGPALAPGAVVGGTDVPRGKPAPDMLLLALDRLGIGPARALMIGDTRFDRQAAQAAGVVFAGYGIEGDLTLEALGNVLGHLELGPD